MHTVTGRYTLVAIILHWLIAVLIVVDMLIGMQFPPPLAGGLNSPKPLLPLHVTIGLLMLFLTIARIAWRLAHRPPPFAPHMPVWERLAARAVHWGFYGLMIAMPLSGWLVRSAHKNTRPIQLVFDIPWPRLPGLSHLPEQTLDVLHEQLVLIHGVLSQQLLLAMLALHVGAVFKHHLIDHHPIIQTILPGRRADAGHAAKVESRV